MGSANRTIDADAYIDVVILADFATLRQPSPASGKFRFLTSAAHDPDSQYRPLITSTSETIRHFLGDLGFAICHLDDCVTGTMTVTPDLCLPGSDHVRSGVLCTLADVVAGRLAASRTAPRLSVTVDLSCVVLRAPPTDRIFAESRVLKEGRTTIVTETRYHAFTGPLNDARPAGPPFAISLGTFLASSRPSDLLPTTKTAMIPIAGSGVPALEMPILDRIGCVERSPGVLEVSPTSEVANSAGHLQGGAVTLLAEGAAQSAADALTGRRCVVWDLDIRFLRALRTGPVRTSAEPLGADASGETSWRVELRDLGEADRLGTVAIARCRPS